MRLRLVSSTLCVLLTSFVSIHAAPSSEASVLEARTAVADSGNVYGYKCGNCKCDASITDEGFGHYSGCIAADSSFRALGVTAYNTGPGGLDNYYTSCSLYTSGDCSGDVVQSVGVEGHNTWGCTAFNQDVYSFQCYYRVNG